MGTGNMDFNKVTQPMRCLIHLPIHECFTYQIISVQWLSDSLCGTDL